MRKEIFYFFFTLDFISFRKKCFIPISTRKILFGRVEHLQGRYSMLTNYYGGHFVAVAEFNYYIYKTILTYQI